VVGAGCRFLFSQSWDIWYGTEMCSCKHFGICIRRDTAHLHSCQITGVCRCIPMVSIQSYSKVLFSHATVQSRHSVWLFTQLTYCINNCEQISLMVLSDIMLLWLVLLLLFKVMFLLTRRTARNGTTVDSTLYRFVKCDWFLILRVYFVIFDTSLFICSDFFCTVPSG